MAKWTRDMILRIILEREKAGRPLMMGRDDGISTALYQAGKRVFGSWPNALSAAGVTMATTQSPDRWSPGRILGIIRSLARRRRPMRSDEVKRRYGPLVAAARRCFGSWAKAVIAAGVDPARLQRSVSWSRERIIESILTRALNNEPLASRSVRPRSLADAGVRHFGSWHKALIAAGLDPDRYSGRGSPGSTSSGVTSDRTTQGNSTTLSSQPDTPAESVAEGVQVFKTTGQGMRRWYDQAVIDGIHQRLAQKKAMNAKSVYREDRPLYRAATRRHHNWSNALLAAGLNPDEFRKHKVGSANRVRIVAPTVPSNDNQQRA
jgi:hypothetical protein